MRVPAEPAWYRRATSSGRPMREVGVLQGTYLAIYVGASCTFWRQGLECRFCTTGLNEDARTKKSVDDVVETALAAKESGVTFVHLNAGYQGGAGARLVAPYVEALKQRVGTLVGVQIAPEAPRAEFDVRVFAGLVATGLDRMVDYNCVSAQQKGVCPGTGCAHDLRIERECLLS